jgi:hypothetical protein
MTWAGEVEVVALLLELAEDIVSSLDSQRSQGSQVSPCSREEVESKRRRMNLDLERERALYVMAEANAGKAEAEADARKAEALTRQLELLVGFGSDVQLELAR